MRSLTAHIIQLSEFNKPLKTLIREKFISTHSWALIWEYLYDRWAFPHRYPLAVSRLSHEPYFTLLVFFPVKVMLCHSSLLVGHRNKLPTWTLLRLILIFKKIIADIFIDWWVQEKIANLKISGKLATAWGWAGCGNAWFIYVNLLTLTLLKFLNVMINKRELEV